MFNQPLSFHGSGSLNLKKKKKRKEKIAKIFLGRLCVVRKMFFFIIKKVQRCVHTIGRNMISLITNETCFALKNVHIRGCVAES